MMVVVAIGGSMGTLLRYQILLNWPVTLGEEFPLPVIITNLIASLFLGIFLAVFHQPHGRWSTQSNARAFLTAGVVGGLATLSLPMVNVPLLIKLPLIFIVAAVADKELVFTLPKTVKVFDPIVKLPVRLREGL